MNFCVPCFETCGVEKKFFRGATCPRCGSANVRWGNNRKQKIEAAQLVLPLRKKEQK